MEISAAKKSLFKKAFDKRSKDEQDNQSASSSFLQNAIKGNQRLNESIDGRKNNSNNLREISIGNNQTDQPPLNFDIDLEDDGSGKIKGEFKKEINPNLDVGAFYETKVGENTGDDYGLSANYKNKLFNLDFSYGKGNNINANANFDYKF
jgi:hypothetical protein|tara:strand:+ start:63 stop:512 length:450 start_codon:yes stop_codon:yes gene_type:complete